jgi:hypothetical protein
MSPSHIRNLVTTEYSEMYLIFSFVRACVCVCVCVRARACVCVCTVNTSFVQVHVEIDDFMPCAQRAPAQLVPPNATAFPSESEHARMRECVRARQDRAYAPRSAARVLPAAGSACSASRPEQRSEVKICSRHRRGLRLSVLPEALPTGFVSFVPSLLTGMDA